MADAWSDVTTFEYEGCRIDLVDGADIVAVARLHRVELLHGAAFPAPVRQVRFTVAGDDRDSAPVHVLEARIRTGPPVLGNDPIGVMLARRVAAGDPWAARVVGGVEALASEFQQRLGHGRTAGDAAAAEYTDEATGLRAAVTDETAAPGPGRPGGAGRVIAVRATVASAMVTPTHVGAMFGLVLRVVADLAGGGASLAGRRYVLSRHASGDSVESAGPDQVTLDQVGGLDAVVAEFRQIAVSFQHPQAMARWGARRPQGILMYGPPGTGKTMLARALANEIGADFREIRTPEILDKWLGASERNIKRIFRAARRYREPTLLLFDEFDSIISYTGAPMDAASQAVNAVAGIFKQEMNNLIEDNPNVIVVATTNFPDRVDDSLIRSGRFDIKLAIPVPDEAGRAEIFAKMIRQLAERHDTAGFRMFADDIDPRGLAAACPGMTGADIKEALRRVQLAKAMQEARTGVAPPPIGQQELIRYCAELPT